MEVRNGGAESGLQVVAAPDLVLVADGVDSELCPTVSVVFELVEPAGLSGLVGEVLTRFRALASDADFAKRLGAEARRRMETIYGPDTHFEKLTALYERAIAAS